MDNSIIVEHLLMSLIPGGIGIVVGGALGGVFAYGSHRLFVRNPRLLKPAALLPWRTAIAGLLVVIWSPFTVTELGSGPMAGACIVGLVITLLAMDGALITLFESYHPSPMPAVLVAGTRALLIISLVVAMAIGYFEGGGIGGYIMAQEVGARQEAFAAGRGILLGIIFFLDIVFGSIQYLMCNRFEKKSREE